ncbi:MAG TPA: type II secretion system F family protein [Dehalococcoidia bacterium]|jgi:type IV pilus assembly protein PilC|nr:type II secretion system F family protein [Dehalococcoidia bacterium]
MAYKYIAYTPQKKLVKGTLPVAQQAAAVEALEQAGLQILSLKEVKEWPLKRWLPPLFAVRAQDVILFSRQLAMMLERGTSFLAALQLAREQVSGRALRKVLCEVISDVETGITFSEAVARHPRAFSAAYSRMVRVGEKTGKLETILRQIADYMEHDETTKKRVKSAVTYPFFVVMLGIITAVILVMAVIPPLTHIFAEFNTALPWPTRLILAISRFIQSYKFYLLGTSSSLVLLVIWYVQRPSGRYLLERLLMKIPQLGRIILVRTIAHFSRITSVLIGAGLPLVEVIPLARQTVTSEVLRRELDKMPSCLLQGQSLSQAMSSSKLFPGMVNQLVRLGEETNTLEKSFSTLADHYDFEFNQAMNIFISMLEPLLVLFVGLLVGFIALAAMMPIYSIYDVMG